jgi:zinc-ribbon domain/Sel1 repeat
MLETMYVRCTHCGYDNSPEYRFCGMCGASLAHPPVATKPPLREVTAKEPATEKGNNGSNGNPESVHGPSFLGLAEDPKTEFHYLYEDEPPRSYAGIIFFVVLLLGVGGFGTWQWRHHGFPFNGFGGNSGSAQSASPSEVAPAQTQDQQTHIDKPMTGAGEVLPATPDQNKQPDTGKTTEFPAQGGQTPPAPTTTNAPPSANTNQEAAPSEKTQEPPTEEAKATPPPRVSSRSKKASHTPTPKPTPKPVETASAIKASPDSDLELSGERYLYGTGVPQNCTRAEASLRTAATHGNSKAQTVLGTMYATGHCVGRDLPTAYRWFARALHQDPQNTRISADLQVLWRQMTPQEKQLATTGQ